MGQVLEMCSSDDALEESKPAEKPAEKFKVIGKSGATIRASEALDSPILCTLTPGTELDVVEVKGRRARILQPVKGWGSLATESGYIIIEGLSSSRPRFKVEN